jgi:hypothetical protein
MGNMEISWKYGIYHGNISWEYIMENTMGNRIYHGNIIMGNMMGTMEINGE